jgi:DNA-binding transcriptional regulator YdaS (Cro superfamily)
MFEEYINSVGGQSCASRRLGVSHSILSRVKKGHSSISKKLARAIEKDSGGRFKKEDLVFEKG